MNILSSLLSVVSGSLNLIALFAHAATGNPGQTAVDNVLGHLRTGAGFYSEVTKKVHSGQLDNTTESKGEIYFAKGKLRLEFSTPEKSLLVFDGAVAWQETEFDDGTEQRAIVTKIRAGHIKKDSAILAAVLGDQNLLAGYKMTKHENDHFEFVPKKKKDGEIAMFKIDIHDGKLQRLGYVDDLENEVSFEFDDLKEKEIPAKKFQYVPPKGADVSEL